MNIRQSCLTLTVLFVATLSSSVQAADTDKPLSETEIKKKIIAESIASYPGRCPCPYNVTKNGSQCGGRSAWSKAGGYAPICYENEITKDMIQEWRDSQ